MIAWVVLFVCLASTAGLAWARSTAVSDSRQAAIDTAESHFRDVVSDIELRLMLAEERLDGLSVAALTFLDAEDAPDTEAASAYLANSELVERVPDAVGVVLYSVTDHDGGESRSVEYLSPGSPVEFELADQVGSTHHLTEALSESNASGEARLVQDVQGPSTGEEYSVVVYPTVAQRGPDVGRRILTVWYPAHQFMASAISDGHHIRVSLAPTEGGAAIVGTTDADHSGHDGSTAVPNVPPAGEATHNEPADEASHGDSANDEARHHEPADAGTHDEPAAGDPAEEIEPENTEPGADGQAPIVHDHEGIGHIHNGDSGFEAQSSVELMGTSFELQASSRPGFVNVPSSREVRIVVVAGSLMSLALFLLIRRLVNSLRRHSEAVASLGESNSRFQAGFENAPTGMAELDLHGSITRANDAFCGQLGRSRDELLGHVLGDVVHAEDRGLHYQTLKAIREGRQPSAQLEVRYQGPDDTPIWVLQSLAIVADPSGHPTQFLVQSQDVTARRRAETMLARRALHDELTGLPNRALLMDRLDHALRHCERTDSRLAVLFLDLDRFKIVNDSLGHTAGDELLTAVGRRLANAVRSHDTIARFGGDEFVLLCELGDADRDPDIVIDRVSSALSTPITVGGTELLVTASIGLAVGGGRGSTDTPEALLRDADAAMYMAKESGRNQTAVFDDDMRAAAVDRLALEQALRNAPERDEFELVYQPLIGTSGSAIEGVEALIRWRHPERGLLTPDAFLNVATDVGMIEAIDRFAFNGACEQLAEWTKTYPDRPSLLMAVNTSSGTFLNKGFITFVKQTISATGVDAARLWIEVTESALLDNTDAAIATMEQLRRLGVRIAIDDFGSGYSSLSYLTKFPFDILKLDRSFLRENNRDHPHAAVLAAVADLARAVGTPVVIEGIETAQHLALVASVKATYMQGYLFDRARDPSYIEARYLAPGSQPRNRAALVSSAGETPA